MSQLSKIWEGIYNYGKHQLGILDERVFNKGQERLDVCERCPEWTGNKDTVIRVVDNCSICGCTTSFMILSSEKECPLGKWKSYKVEDLENEIKNGDSNG